MTTTKTVLSPTAFDFLANPVTVISTTPGVVNYVATGQGRSVAANGIWNTSVLPASGVVPISQGANFVAPLTAANIPPNNFDAIILLVIDAIRYPIGFSNSPDNVNGLAGSTTVVNSNTFWTDLFCFGNNNIIGSNVTNNNFMFGGAAAVLNTAVTPRIIFSKPLAENLTVTITYRYFSYTTGYKTALVRTTAIVPGSLTYNIGAAFVPQTLITNSIEPGFIEVTVSVNLPNYKSLLNVFHWGVSS